jgi:hypothetical protein
MGRRTYEEMSAFWPHQRGVYAELMNDTPKAVFSSSSSRTRFPRAPRSTSIGLAAGELVEEREDEHEG